MPLLAEIPLEPELREGADTGDPVVVTHPETASARAISASRRAYDSVQAPPGRCPLLAAAVSEAEAEVGLGRLGLLEAARARAFSAGRPRWTPGDPPLPANAIVVELCAPRQARAATPASRTQLSAAATRWLITSHPRPRTSEQPRVQTGTAETINGDYARLPRPRRPGLGGATTPASTFANGSVDCET